MQLRRILLMSAFTAAGLPLLGQTTNLAHPTPVAATAPTAVPALVAYAVRGDAGDGGIGVTGFGTTEYAVYGTATTGYAWVLDSGRTATVSVPSPELP